MNATKLATLDDRAFENNQGSLATRARKRRLRRISRDVFCLLWLATIIMSAIWLNRSGLATDLSMRHLHPSIARPLGTDWLGRDMFTRVLFGLRLSLWVGSTAALTSAVIGLIMGLLAGFGGKIADQLVAWLIDLVMSLPHLVFQILIAFAVGGGANGVIIAVALTHWASLARVIRTEVANLKTREYVMVSAKLGRSNWWIARHHFLRHLLPQFLVGLMLMFPHAISHEAALSFVGLGLAPHMPSMGIVLAESLRHLSTGFWWLALFPGVALLITVKAFDVLGEDVRSLCTPRMRQER